ncbi:MAG: ATP-dependent DNA helicase RecG [Clostridia bacterium]|nr:ATP-dependent DNA helicase RecG [Clostridia bacterium]
MKLQDSITTLKGIGPKKAEAFARLGIETLEDLVYTFPRLYEDRRNVVPIAELREGENAVFTGTVDVIKPGGYSRRGGRVLKMLISDDTGSVEVVFFNAYYLSKTIHMGDRLTFFGKPQDNRGRLQVAHPEFSRESDVQTGILSIYPLTKGISQREMRKLQQTIRPLYAEAESILSSETEKRNNLCDIGYAIENVHFPADGTKLREAKYRLVFDEFMVLQTGLQTAKADGGSFAEGARFDNPGAEQEYIDSLPYSLTGAQERCVREIAADLESGRRMNRLVQGDVGSGKTAVAEIAMFKAAKCGYQSVMMAPTEILAHQHFEGFKAGLAKHGISVGFLSGSMKAAEKRDVLSSLADGSIHVLVGTHAVIQPEVEFSRLGLVITDEQHRFGVNQRILLKEKGENPNILVMTATPIPRTLAVVIYGDMDVSVIDEMPPGRLPVYTRCADDGRDRMKVYDFAERQIWQGKQVYVVTPLIDESEAMDARSAQEVYEELSKRFDRVALIHGAMKQNEKDEIMAQFSEGLIDILVATVVIEVGINVPNATVMIIENAERFGLAQLHQLRGRVGRGSSQSYCFLVQGSDSELAKKRGEIMEKSNDGFYIAEEDMKIRGPGEIFGTRQHGLPDMKLADMVRHIDVLNTARDEAKAVLADDPGLVRPENIKLKNRVKKLFGDDFSLNL